MEEGKALRVMTFNIRHGQGMNDVVDLSQIVNELVQGKADIIALQEVDRWNTRSGFVDQIARIGKAMGMYWCFSPSLRIGLTQYGNATLSRWPISRSQNYFLPGRRERRSVLHTRIQINGITLHILNTHLGVSLSDRKIQVPLLKQIMDTIKEPSLVMGDFNMQDGNPLMQELLTGWSKIKLEKKASTVIGGMEIDHILVNWPDEHVHAWTQPTFASDHDPVLADIPFSVLHLTKQVEVLKPDRSM